MPSFIHSEYSAPLSFDPAAGIQLHSLAAGSMAHSVALVPGGGSFTDPMAPQVEILYKITEGGSAVANELIEFYISRSPDNTAGSFSGGLSTAYNASPGTASPPKNQLQFVHAQVVNGTPASYVGSFIIDNPGPVFKIVVVNETSGPTDATPTDHYLKYRYISPEVQ